MGKVILVPNRSYLFSAGTIGAHRGARDNTLLPIFHHLTTPYNTFTTIQQTPIPSTHPTHFPCTLPGYTAAPTPVATLPTTKVPYNIPTTLHTTHAPPYNPHYLPATSPPPFPLLSTIPFPPSTTTTPTQTSPPLHRFHRQHPPSHPVGTLHTRPLHR